MSAIAKILGFELHYEWDSTAGCGQTTQSGTIVVISACTVTGTFHATTKKIGGVPMSSYRIFIIIGILVVNVAVALLLSPSGESGRHLAKFLRGHNFLTLPMRSLAHIPVAEW